MIGGEYLRTVWMSWWMLLLFAGIALVFLGAFLVVLVRCFASRNCFSPPPETPLDILKKRYARGDISAGEYEHMKHFLED